MTATVVLKACVLACLLTVTWTGLLTGAAQAAPLHNVPQTITQPDGMVIHCFASGDEYYNYLHDAEGYVIIRDALGWYTFAAKQDGSLVPSAAIVGRDDPASLQVPPHLRPSPQVLKQETLPYRDMLSAAPSSTAEPAPRVGTINNLVIFIRFADEVEFTDSTSGYDDMFNSTAPGANSMRAYYEEVSYGALHIYSSFYPTPVGGFVRSYQDGHDRDYYRPYDAATNPVGYIGSDQRTQREHTLLRNACAAVDADVPGGLTVDQDGDGYVDSVCFVISGSPEGWSDLLWPHRWVLYTQNAYLNGKRVWDYAFQLQDSMNTGVLCHEMFHVLGAPDLYHYYDQTDMSPVWKWDVMEYNLDPPQHMGCYMKMHYGGWIDSIPEISTSGTYTVNPLASSTNQCYKIASSDPSQYYVVEYRKKTGSFESSLPGTGLLVYRINTAAEGVGNRDLPDEVYIYRPGGTTSENGIPDSAHFSADTGRTAINGTTDPTAFLVNGAHGGLTLYDVTTPDETISFTVALDPVPATSSAHIAIEHDWIGDLVVRIGVGSPDDPLWAQVVSDREGGSTSNLVRDIDLSDAEEFLPPSPRHVWFLEVRDALVLYEGSIAGFTVSVDGKTYTACGLPIPIHDYQTSYAYITGQGLPVCLNLLLQ